MKYRKKPVEVEAWQWEGKWLNECENVPKWIWDAVEDYDIIEYIDPIYKDDSILEIDTLEGTHTARPGDYIIKGVKGELYPCKPEIFEMTYEEVTE